MAKLLGFNIQKTSKVSSYRRWRLTKHKVKPVILVIIDGFGVAPSSDGNAISLASTPNLTRYQTSYPYGELIAAGESVGLPANEAGNSEVGHLTIGSGRVIDQSLVRINKAVEDRSFFENPALISSIRHSKKFKSKMHVMGLISSGSVHSDFGHFKAVVDLLKKNNVMDAAFHLFTDGRDAQPKEGINTIKEADLYIKKHGVGRIESITGRYWAMDRDFRWERTKLAYDAITQGIGQKASSAIDAVRQSYAQDITDEFIKPTVITNAKGGVDLVGDNDAVVFFNFRVDRSRQLSMAFVRTDFENLKGVEFQGVDKQGKVATHVASGPTFQRQKVLNNIFFVTMTQYHKTLPVSAIAFPPVIIKNSLPEVLSKTNLNQMHLAESEKERMVTFYFDGLKEERYKGEDVVIVPSPKVATYDLKPEMSAHKISKEFNKRLNKDKYHFFVINFANPDMVAHSGNIKATIKAIEHADSAISSIVDPVLICGGTVIITADHGNAEQMLTYPKSTFFYTSTKGKLNTEHSNSPAPIYIINDSLHLKYKVNLQGSLSDVAPTILYLMGIEIPSDMTGENLLK